MKKILLTITLCFSIFALTACNNKTSDYIIDSSTLEEIWESNKIGNVKERYEASVMTMSSEGFLMSTLYLDKDSNICIQDNYYQYSYNDHDIVYNNDTDTYDAMGFTNEIDFNSSYMCVMPNSNEEIISSNIKGDIASIKTSMESDNGLVERTYTYNLKDKQLLNVIDVATNDYGTLTYDYAFWYGNEDNINDEPYNDIHFDNLLDAIEKEKNIPEDLVISRVLGNE